MSILLPNYTMQAWQTWDSKTTLAVGISAGLAIGSAITYGFVKRYYAAKSQKYDAIENTVQTYSQNASPNFILFYVKNKLGKSPTTHDLIVSCFDILAKRKGMKVSENALMVN